jgi:hypothetical protein
MRTLNLHTFHKGIADHRFDAHNSYALHKVLALRYRVTWHEHSGDELFEFEGVKINQGSIIIVEDVGANTFRTYDFGDHPSLTVRLSKSPRFEGALIGQYNKEYWDKIVIDPEIRARILPGPYPESVWALGTENYDQVQAWRKQMALDTRLYWRGSLYSYGVEPRYLGVRRAIELLPEMLPPDELQFGSGAIPFEAYMQEALRFETALSIGGGGGALCGDFCFRDIEMFGLGIPLIRPKYIVESTEPLIPDFHYIAVDAEFDAEYRYKNPEELAQRIVAKYKELQNRPDKLKYLDFVRKNAKEWYDKVVSYPNITNNILKGLNL